MAEVAAHTDGEIYSSRDGKRVGHEVGSSGFLDVVDDEWSALWELGEAIEHNKIAESDVAPDGNCWIWA
eukprot:1633039-Pleurochrysis_carterae.AAC.1